jgi:aminopeptidase-like protein
MLPVDELNMGLKMYNWAKDLFPIGRSLMGKGVRETLAYLKNELPELKIRSVPTGEKIFDWEVPDEWVIRDAYIIDPDGHKILEYKKNNLNLVGYSEPVNTELTLDELQSHLYSIEDMPDAIPYVTSYYKRMWGFCIEHRKRIALKPGKYRVVVDSEFIKGQLNYGEVILPGESSEETFLSTYICHPSMGNNELSGPVVTLGLLQWIKSLPKRRYTYRAVFIPETIGSIAYLSRHGDEMKEKVRAGFVLTCVGDNLAYSFIPSRKGNTYADKVAEYVFRDMNIPFNKYSFLQRGSDERQYCSPVFDLPVVSLMRSKYGTFKEYHTSLDNLDFISAEGLYGGFAVNQACITCLENNFTYKVTISCEPKMDKRGLRSSIGGPRMVESSMLNLMNFLMYADGKTDLIDIASIIGISFTEALQIAEQLESHGLITKIKETLV